MVTLSLTEDFKEFLRLLDSEKTEYLLVGGYAVALYGHVRPTKDMDVWVSAAPENLDRLRTVLQKFGFNPESLPSPLFADQKSILRMGMPPHRLEVITNIAAVEFGDCYTRRKRLVLDGVEVWVIDIEDLKKNKSAAGRPQDLNDVRKLEAGQKPRK